MVAIDEIRRSEAPAQEREAAARATLRAQVARLDRELAVLAASSYPRLDLPLWDSSARAMALSGPRLLSLGELERLRDALAARLSELRAAAEAQAARQAQAQHELDRMLADPAANKWRRLTNADLGRPGCTTYHVRPRAGVVGMLMGWWQVKISGGCPLAA
jgi:hypothetical protein